MSHAMGAGDLPVTGRVVVGKPRTRSEPKPECVNTLFIGPIRVGCIKKGIHTIHYGNAIGQMSTTQANTSGFKSITEIRDAVRVPASVEWES